VQFRFRIGCCRDDRLADGGGIVAVLHRGRDDVVEVVPLLRVDRQGCVGPHNVRRTLVFSVGGLDEKSPEAVFADSWSRESE
jgi:hypothetical protein